MSGSMKEAQIKAVEKIRQEILAEITEGKDLDNKLEHFETGLENLESQAPFNEEEWISLSKMLHDRLSQVETEAEGLLGNIRATRGELNEIGQMFAEDI